MTTLEELQDAAVNYSRAAEYLRTVRKAPRTFAVAMTTDHAIDAYEEALEALKSAAESYGSRGL
jgi:hypothetical protein